MQITNVILSGGSGTRLWPLSRHSRPKQFLQLFENRSLFQHTIQRNAAFAQDFILVTNAQQAVMANTQAAELETTIAPTLIEPIGRNTAPAIALACLASQPDTILFITPSDQMIVADELYKNALERAATLAEAGNLVTFGIQPKHPDTGFGYIQADGENVTRFTEKPDLETAKSFLEAGNYYWNSGMFCFKASAFLAELEIHHPEMLAACKTAFEATVDGEIPLELMQAIPADSIDYAVMEQSDNVKVVPSEFHWTDLGSFDALVTYGLEHPEQDIVQVVEGCEQVYAIADQPVFASGLKNTIIVQTSDATLMLPLNESSRVKAVYNKVKADQPDLTK